MRPCPLYRIPAPRRPPSPAEPTEPPAPARMAFDRDLAAALAYSRFATQSLAAHPEDVDWLAAHVEAPADVSGVELADAVAAADGERLASALRTLRRRTLLVTLARDLTGRGDLDEVCTAMTALAEAALGAAVTAHHAALATIHGEPRDEAGVAQQLVVIGMGKLGGGELNVSS